MRDEDKPFICYKSGWTMKIVPRGAFGWWSLVGWMLALVPICVTYIYAMSRDPSPALMWADTAAYGVALAIWSIVMIRWLKARSEIVDVAELREIKRRADRSSKRGGRNA
ncbi:MAG TPA: hypothetical protein VM055_05455 [Novosphingobium sp.]|nr:hypothetical protein [Novosphingobium sp.]